MNILILLPILLALISAFVVYFIKDRKYKNITLFALLSLVLVLSVVNCFVDTSILTLVNITRTLSISFKIDGISKLFSVAISFVWLLVTIYTFEYIKHENNENRFYTFSSLTLATLLALTYSANLVTMYLSFEMVTLLSMPLVLHSLTKESIAAAKKYLYYSIGGAFLALFGIFVLEYYSNSSMFSSYGGLDVFKNFTGNKTLIHVAILSLIIGFAAKGGMFPLHGWLPVAHPVAPSPASALLSGVITKAGVIAIIRVIFYVVGPEFIASTWVQYVFIGLTLFTIFMGSLLASIEKVFKKRLAYSSVSQISYVLVGLALLNDVAFIGALLHVVAHMLIKVCLFLFAGEGIYKFHFNKVSELKGIGKIMPISSWCYTIASLGLIGIPLTAGFTSKWYLASGAISSSLGFLSWLVPVVLLVSAILTAGYLLPITFNGFFVGEEKFEKNEASKLMYIPMIILALLIIVVGVFNQPLIDLIMSIMKG